LVLKREIFKLEKTGSRHYLQEEFLVAFGGLEGISLLCAKGFWYQLRNIRESKYCACRSFRSRGEKGWRGE
jgi:hypothetical protein